jgi:Fe-S cluster biogenesis protein NfuA/nitrite reductase/ring-hydroxylating ferredoxin subunit
VLDAEARERVGRIDAILEAVDGLADPRARETATEAVQALVELYGEGLARLVAHVADHDDGRLAEALAADELVAHLLLLHGLHPVPLEARVRGALDEVRPYLASHGGDVELLGIEDGIARLRMEGSCKGCPSSAVTLRLAIEDAIEKAAPDLEGIEAEGAVEPAAPPGLIQLDAAPSGLIQLEIHTPLPAAPAPAAPAPAPGWTTAGGLPELTEGRPLVRDVAGEPVLFARVDGSVYAYRPGCPACGASLGEAAASGAELTCPACGHAYDVVFAGRCRDVPELHLDPLPLLVDDAGLMRVALGAAG